MATWPERFDWLLPRLDAVAGRAGLSVRRQEYDLRLVEADARAIVAQVVPFTMTDPLAVVGLLDAIDHLPVTDVDGAFVECGVWRGGRRWRPHCGCSSVGICAICGCMTPMRG